MTTPSVRRQAAKAKIDSFRAILGHVVEMGDETIYSGLDPVVRERLAGSRMSPRLAMRRARRICPSGLFTQSDDHREALLYDRGPEGIEALMISVGSHVLWSDIIRLVQRTERDSLDAELGISARIPAMRGREHNFGVVAVDEAAGSSLLAERILREGALCWACWLAGRDRVSARRLRVLTSETVSTRIGGALPGTAGNRKKRRQVVDLEIDEFVRLANFEAGEREVA